MRERANERGTILYEGWRPAGEKRWPEHRGHIPVSREKKYSGSGDGTKRRVAMAQPGSPSCFSKERKRYRRISSSVPATFATRGSRDYRERGREKELRNGERNVATGTSDVRRNRGILNCAKLYRFRARNGGPDERYGTVTSVESSRVSECQSRGDRERIREHANFSAVTKSSSSFDNDATDNTSGKRSHHVVLDQNIFPVLYPYNL